MNYNQLNTAQIKFLSNDSWLASRYKIGGGEFALF